MKRQRNERQRGAEYRQHQRNFSHSMSKALYLATKRPVPILEPGRNCQRCNVEFLRAKQDGRDVFLCMKCGAITPVKDVQRVGQNDEIREVANG